MTTTQIVTLADMNNLAGPEMDLQLILRTLVVPEFLHDVGYVWWRRNNLDVTVPAGQNTASLPINAGHIKRVLIGPSFADELCYVADLDARMQFDTTQVTAPTSFYTKPDTAGTVMYLNATLAAETTYRLVYDLTHFGEDYTNEIELNQYIPVQFQGGLVYGLRMQILESRIGRGDRRYDVAERQYQTWVARASESQENGAPQAYVYVR